MSNHYGMILDNFVGALAFWGDDVIPNSNQTHLEYSYKHYISRLRRHMLQAFGTKGWFAEGDGVLFFRKRETKIHED